MFLLLFGLPALLDCVVCLGLGMLLNKFGFDCCGGALVFGVLGVVLLCLVWVGWMFCWWVLVVLFGLLALGSFVAVLLFGASLCMFVICLGGVWLWLCFGVGFVGWLWFVLLVGWMLLLVLVSV